MRPLRCGPNLWWCAPFSNARDAAAAAQAALQRWPTARITAGTHAIWVDGPAHLDAVTIPSASHRAPVRHVIPVTYDGLDLGQVAQRCEMSTDDVISLHAAPDYLVELLGFLPGFAYLTGLDPRLIMPRRSAPRPSVPANSVAMAGPMGGIYPSASPGGWHLLGTAQGVALFDPAREQPCLFAPGDVVRFVPTEDRQPAAATLPWTAPAFPALKVVASLGWVTVQDAGRPHVLAQGIPASGAWDAALLASRNAALNQPWNAAALEVWQGDVTLEALRKVTVSSDSTGVRVLHPGEQVRVRAALDYLAVEGGVEVPVVLGSRATLASSGLGGLAGRPLRRGDTFDIGTRVTSAEQPQRSTPLSPLRVWPAPPHPALDQDALQALVRGPWRVSPQSNRLGVRLQGAPLPRRGTDGLLPAPMCRGAVQVATDGTPMILGPDHPATGGYPVVAVVEPASLAALARVPAGAQVEFVLV